MIGDFIRRQIDAAIASEQPLLIVVAGSNGAGKSTFYQHALAHTGLPFVNADEIARQIRGHYIAADDPLAYEAMRLADEERQRLIAARHSFIMETVLSDEQGAKLKFFQELTSVGYLMLFIYIRLDNPTLSTLRVMQRVNAGGHDVPDDKLLARFPRTQRNAAAALKMADLALVLDNSDIEHPYRWCETWQHGVLVEQASP
jgi:predicted ABC-type ATPase